MTFRSDLFSFSQLLFLNSICYLHSGKHFIYAIVVLMASLNIFELLQIFFILLLLLVNIEFVRSKTINIGGVREKVLWYYFHII